MKEILESIKPVVDNSRFVSINEAAIDRFVESIQGAEMEKSEFDQAPQLPQPTEENYIGFAIVYNAINFCYWGTPKWTVEYNNKSYDGSYGLTQAFINALRSSYDLLNPTYLANLTKEDLSVILKGNVQIPLFEERLRLLRLTGQILNDKFQGSWMNVIKKGNNDAEEIVCVLTEDFTEVFKDEAILDGHTVKFYKRAQLVPAYIDHDLLKLGVVSIKLSNIDKLTAFADYKVPQILRKFGILEYTQDLSQKIDSLTELLPGSREEIEIRANTIMAIERATQKAKKRFPNATAARIDGIIWFRGQKKYSNDKPYHRTETIWY